MEARDIVAIVALVFMIFCAILATMAVVGFVLGAIGIGAYGLVLVSLRVVFSLYDVAILCCRVLGNALPATLRRARQVDDDDEGEDPDPLISVVMRHDLRLSGLSNEWAWSRLSLVERENQVLMHRRMVAAWQMVLPNGRYANEVYSAAFQRAKSFLRSRDWGKFARAMRRRVVERWRVEHVMSAEGVKRYRHVGNVWFPYLARKIEQTRLEEMEEMCLQTAMVVGEDGDLPVPVSLVRDTTTRLWRMIAKLCSDNNRAWRKREYGRIIAVIPAAKRVLNYVTLKHGPIKPRTDLERRSAYIACGEALTALERQGLVTESKALHADIVRCAVHLAMRGYHIREPAPDGVQLAY